MFMFKFIPSSLSRAVSHFYALHARQFRVYAGFDAQIFKKGNSEKRCCSLYIYSRQSGRLITHHIDARTILGLSAGGTEFCSGLRVIMDDFEGILPLNPTKVSS
jgi:hypothetical protein